jgi:hypothetical protein
MLSLLRIDPLQASAVVRVRRPIIVGVRPDVHPSLLVFGPYVFSIYESVLKTIQ